jgi:hypothetical protein
MRYGLPSLALLSLLPLSLAAPAPVAEPIPVATPEPTLAASLENAAALEERQLLGGLLSGLGGVVSGLLGSVNSAVAADNPVAAANALVQLKAGTRPTDIPDALSRASRIWASPTGRTDFYPALATQVAAGLGPLLDGTLNTALTGGLPVGENSIGNTNKSPPTKIFPKKDNGDAPYSVLEASLRAAIYVPSTFTYGSKRPVIMVPGTGAYGGTSFANNLRKLLVGKPFADPVWLNIPGAMLMDSQTNAEYIAYAINYISSISNSNKNIAVMTWSQGGLATQWAFKYWPSTRKVVKDLLAVSPDFKGTIFTNALCLSADNGQGLNPCPPSVISQEVTSNFIQALRSNGGDSAYVPTTTIYSGLYDEIVEPQQGTIASAFINDARGVGVSNNEVQSVCAGRIAGGFYGHAGVLFHPLAYALFVDALTHEGPADLSRIDKSVCDLYAAQGLDLDDVIATSGLIPIAGVLLLTYPVKLVKEVALRPYAS